MIYSLKEKLNYLYEQNEAKLLKKQNVKPKSLSEATNIIYAMEEKLIIKEQEYENLKNELKQLRSLYKNDLNQHEHQFKLRKKVSPSKTDHNNTLNDLENVISAENVLSTQQQQEEEEVNKKTNIISTHEIEDISNAFERYEMKINNLKKEYEIELNTLLKDNTQLKANNSVTIQLLHDQEEYNKKLQHEIAELEIQLSSRPTNIEWQNLLKKQKLFTKQYNSSTHKKNLELAEHKILSLKADIKFYKNENDKYLNRYNDLKHRYSSLKAEVPSPMKYKKFQKEYSLLKSEHVDILNDYGIIKLEKEQLMKECHELKEQLSDINAKNDDLYQKIINNDIYIEEQKKEMKDIQHVIKHKENSFESTRVKFEKLIQEKESLQQIIQDKNKEISHIRNELVKDKNMKRTYDVEIKKLSSQISLKDQQVNDLLHDKLSLKDQLVNVQQELLMNNTNYKQMKTDYELLTAEKLRIEKKYQSLKDRHITIEQELYQSKDIIAKLKREKLKLESMKTSMNKNLELTDQKYLKITTELKESQQLYHELSLKYTKEQKDIEIYKSKYNDSLLDLIENLQLELEARPTNGQWRQQQIEIDKLKTLLANKAQIKSLRHILATQSNITTSQLIQHDKLDHRLQLDQLDQIPNVILIDLIKDICRLLKIQNISLMIPILKKMNHVIEIVPSMKSFIHQVTTLVVKKGLKGAKGVSGSKTASKTVQQEEVEKEIEEEEEEEIDAVDIEQVIPQLHQWYKALQLNKQYHQFYQTVMNTLSVNNHIITGYKTSIFSTKMISLVQYELEDLCSKRKRISSRKRVTKTN